MNEERKGCRRDYYDADDDDAARRELERGTYPTQLSSSEKTGDVLATRRRRTKKRNNKTAGAVNTTQHLWKERKKERRSVSYLSSSFWAEHLEKSAPQAIQVMTKTMKATTRKISR